MRTTTWVKIASTLGIPVNVATEEKQDAGNALLTSILAASGGSSGAYQTIIATHSTVSTTKYVGVSLSGSATSGALWQITRLDTSSGLVVKNAGGVVTYTNIWDSREALSYS